jgi:hypothetical protein
VVRASRRSSSGSADPTFRLVSPPRRDLPACTFLCGWPPGWQVDDPTARKLQRIQFHKNMAMIGGLLFAVVDPA